MIRVQCWAYLWSARWLPGQWYCSSERAEHDSQSSAGAAATQAASASDPAVPCSGRRHAHRDCNHDAANTMTVMVKPTRPVRAGSEGGWFIGGRMANAKSIGWAIYSAWICDLDLWLLELRPRGSLRRSSRRAICVIFITLQNFFGTALEKG